MRKLYKLGALVLIVLLLGGCVQEYLDPLPAQNPFKYADHNLWGFISYVETNWTYEADAPYEPCQDPRVSYRRMRGDCDDFAVMVAYYVQEAYSYDTFVIFTDWVGRGGHAVAFLRASKRFEEQMADYCGAYPFWTEGDSTYVPVDMPQNGGTCPVWTWLHSGLTHTTEYEWYDLVGLPL